LGSMRQEIIYEPITNEQSSTPRVFRIKKDLSDIPVTVGEGSPLDVIEETESTEISRATVEQAVAEIRSHVPDFSGLPESEVRDRLTGE
jgi:hypothetical protein